MRGRTKSPKSVSFSFGLFHLRHSKMLKTVRNYNSNSGLVAIQVPRLGKQYCPVNLRWCCPRRFETMIPAMLEPSCDNLKQCRSNVATLFCAENRVWESSHVHSIIVFTNIFWRICKNQLPYLVALICAIQMDEWFFFKKKKEYGEIRLFLERNTSNGHYQCLFIPSFLPLPGLTASSTFLVFNQWRIQTFK